MNLSNRKTVLIIALLIIVSASLKIGLLLADVIPFNSDEAIVALMARHILQGERPIFFYGQVYMGSLDAFLVAAGFAVFGQKVWVIRLVQTLLYAGVLGTTAWVGKISFGSWKPGWLAACFLAVPAVNVTLYTTASLGGYNEALLLGNLTLIVCLFLIQKAEQMPANTVDGKVFCLALLWGVLAGCGLWANGLSLVYAAPAALILLWAVFWHFRHKFLLGQKIIVIIVALVGAAAGALPWLVYALQTGPQRLVLELFGTAVAVEKTPWLVQVWEHFLSFVLLGGTVLLGFRPPWTVRWLGLPMMPFILLFWCGVLYIWFRDWKADGEDRWKKWLLTGVGISLTAGFIFTPFGVDPSGRYFLPLAILLALAAGYGIEREFKKPAWQLICVLFVMVFHLWGTLQSALRYPPGITTQFDQVAVVDHRYNQELIDFLVSEGETRGYTNYWVAYPTAFLSQEEVIFVPHLPYHQDMRYTARDDRYRQYTELVVQSEKVAYITTNHPELDQKLRSSFQTAGVSFQEKKIGDYQIFYGLSQPIRPQDMGLGYSQP